MSEGIYFKLTAPSKHVPKIERRMRVIKELVRSRRLTMSFKGILLIMLIYLIYS